MKRTTIQLLLLTGMILLQVACKKKDDLKIEDTNLTNCPANSECEYLFTESADIEGVVPAFKSGDYRVFWAAITTPGMESRLYIKAPMAGRSFQLDKSAISEGRVVLYQSCPACLMYPLKPIAGGYVKGVNVTPGNSAEQTKWLLEAKIILGDASGATSFRDTLYVKQYFQPNFVFN